MTRQIPDILLYNKKKIYLNNGPLGKYFLEFPEQKPEEEVVSTALWRGYIAIFEIKDDALFIKKIEVPTTIELKFESYLNKSLPNDSKFEWFSGLIRIDDFRDEFDGEPEDGIFEFLEIRNGDLIQIRSMNYKQLQEFKEEQYRYFLMSEDVNLIYELFEKNKPGVLKTNVDEIIRENILFFTKEVYVD